MQRIPSKVLRLIVAAPLILFTGCFSQLDLGSNHLTTALLNEPYEYQFRVEEGWGDFWDDSFVVRLYEGDLPAGVGITADGVLVGSPLELGIFSFRVIVYDVDVDPDTESFSDDEWFSLFVTEPSTRDACPLPNNEEVAEIALCLGSPFEDPLSAGDSFSLDATYYVNFNDSSGYSIRTISFAVDYDPERFEISEESLNSTILREVATRSRAEAVFDASAAGHLEVLLTAQRKDFTRAGRLLDLPFTALAEVEEGEDPFTLTVLEIASDDPDVTLPEILAIDGH